MENKKKLVILNEKNMQFLAGYQQNRTLNILTVRMVLEDS